MINIIKKGLAIFAQGILFGLGFCIAAWALYFAFHPKTQAASENSYDTSIARPSPTKGNPFTFHNVEEIKKNGRSYFIGMVKNNSSTPARGISIEVNLFSKEKFVDQYSSYFTGDIGPGEERYFKVSCGCKDEQLTEHDNYKIAVVGGY